MASTTGYTLTYFNMRGAAESIRYLLKLAGQEFEDVRIEMDEDWPSKKKDYPWEQLPVLDVDGHRIAQSLAIGRLIAKRHGLAGKDEFETAACDEILDALKDLGIELSKWFGGADDEEKAKVMKGMKEVYIPKYFSRFDAIIKKNGEGGWLVGDNVTWTDLFVANTSSTIIHIAGLHEDMESKYSHLNKMIQQVFALPQIAKWIENRPQTMF